MKKTLLGLLVGAAAIAALSTNASAQCIGVGGINTVPQVGVACASEPNVSSYGATSVALVPVAAGATDFFCLAGSTTRVVRLQSISVGGTATTIVTVPLLVMKHVSLDTGAASATGTQIPIPYPLDSGMPAATATARAWITANPTITDAAPGIIAHRNLQLNLPAAVGTTAVIDWYNRLYTAAPTIRGAAQEICLNLNTTAVVAGLVTTAVTWTESPQ